MKKIRNTEHLKLNLLFNLEKKLQKERPEQCLFIAVILQALLDATKPKLPNEEEDTTYERERAKAWFFASVGVTCKDFITVCDHAGVDFSDTRVFAQQLLKSKQKPRVRRRINLLLRKDLPIKI
tara:strand:+ start:385 stop:756 length:372 start_codon:yes stop_codon:yes gene_type:complete